MVLSSLLTVLGDGQFLLQEPPEHCQFRHHVSVGDKVVVVSQSNVSNLREKIDKKFLIGNF